MGYAVVTAVRNEAEQLERLVASLSSQESRPERWILVENGSTDDTAARLAAIAAVTPWIGIVTVAPDERRERGASIVRALHAGLDELRPLPDVVAVVDADVTLPEEYFTRLLETLAGTPELGIVSGTCYELEGGAWRPRPSSKPYVWGAARAYRRDCLEALLPFEPRTGWDAVDVAHANALGWRTETLAGLAFHHHRPEHSRERTRWTAWADQGRLSYFLGYRPSYLVLRAVARGARDPSALGLLGGYVGAALRRSPRCVRPGVREWVRASQRVGRLAARAAARRRHGHQARDR